MKRPDDEMLVAYADGALSAAEAEPIARYLEGDAEARRFVASLQASATMLRDAFADPMRMPPPQALVDRIMAAPIAPPAASNVVPFTAAKRSVGIPKWVGLAAAASIALAVGLTAGQVIERRAGPQSIAEIALGPIERASRVHNVLESQPTGASAALGTATQSSQRAVVMATFRDRLGRACREFELTQGQNNGAPFAAGVACRSPQGVWNVEGAALLAAGGKSGDPAYVPSGANDRDVLDGLISMLGAGKAISPEQERALLQNNWQ